MEVKKTDNRNDNKFMNDYIFRKYKQNINKFVDSVHIFPKDYKRKASLNKRWKVYFFYSRNNKQKQFNLSSYTYSGQNIQINRTKDHDLKVQQIEHLKEAIIHQLKTDMKFVTSLIYGYEEAVNLYPSIFTVIPKSNHKSIEEVFNIALDSKEGKVSYSFYSDLKSVKNRFLKFIGKNKKDSIKLLDKRMLLQFLDSIDASNRTYNNAKSNLSALLTVMKDLEYIDENWLLSVKKLKVKNKVNKPYPEETRLKIAEYLKQNDVVLYYYYLHIYYGLMRPTEVNRLQVKDIDLVKRMYVNESKTKNFVMLIPDKIIQECYSNLDFKNADPQMYLFGVNGMLEFWDTKNKRELYTKKYRKIKKLFKLERVYTWYSFRHNAIGNLFSVKLKEFNNVERTIEYIRQFTNHTTNKQTREYLREISTELHIDISGYLD